MKAYPYIFITKPEGVDDYLDNLAQEKYVATMYTSLCNKICMIKNIWIKWKLVTDGTKPSY